MGTDEDPRVVEAADEAVELEHIAQACEVVDPEEDERLFFDRLHAGWRLGSDGRLHPPKDRLMLCARCETYVEPEDTVSHTVKCAQP